jgi:hypothetical protein
VDDDGVGNRCDLDDGYLIFQSVDRMELQWQEESTYSAFNVYRGDLGVLRAAGLYTQDPAAPLSAQFCGLIEARLDEPFEPPVGAALFYLVSGKAGGVEGSLGPDGAGAERSNSYPCPGG